jgi:hypothetical protein
MEKKRAELKRLNGVHGGIMEWPSQIENNRNA